ncbi:hypothetical protein CSUI_007746, partial [Cystoisospora suis]
MTWEKKGRERKEGRCNAFPFEFSRLIGVCHSRFPPQVCPMWKTSKTQGE